MVVGMSLCVIQKPSGSRENKQKLETSRNSLECGGKFEPVAGLPVDLNISVRGTLAFFLANLWTVEGHLETLPTPALPALGLSLGHLLEMDHLWQKFD